MPTIMYAHRRMCIHVSPTKYAQGPGLSPKSHSLSLSHTHIQTSSGFVTHGRVAPLTWCTLRSHPWQNGTNAFTSATWLDVVVQMRKNKISKLKTQNLAGLRWCTTFVSSSQKAEAGVSVSLRLPGLQNKFQNNQRNLVLKTQNNRTLRGKRANWDGGLHRPYLDFISFCDLLIIISWRW